MWRLGAVVVGGGSSKAQLAVPTADRLRARVGIDGERRAWGALVAWVRGSYLNCSCCKDIMNTH